MIQFKEMGLRRGTRELLTQVSLSISAGARVGITGANGTGKSSLFELFLGRLSADSGDFFMPPDWVVAHVAQETPAVNQPAIEYVIDGDSELRRIQAQLKIAEDSDDGLQQAHLHGQLEHIDGYTVSARAAALMNGLGFSTSQQTQAVAQFSGGWRMRLNLAQALMCRSDLLLLDEPTNHLDLDAVLWLEQWLSSYAGTLLLISHDREFLDAVVNHIVNFQDQSLVMVTGNYSDFEKHKAQLLAQQAALYNKQQRQIKHMESFVRRFRAKATKARQAQSRLKALERISLISPAHVDSPFSFEFAQAEPVFHALLQVEDVRIAYGSNIVLEHINMTVNPGDRIGLLGPNGAGKSSLIRLLAQKLSVQSGTVQQSNKLCIGYFAQHQLEQLDSEASPLTHVQRLDKQASEQSIRDFLGGFGFHGDQVTHAVAPFSGGEKARLVLALLVYQKPNLLLLDEPTNHLDLEMRHSLALALQSYSGAMIVVSHDRYLLNSVCDQFYLVAKHRVQEFDGDLDDYRQWMLEQKISRSTPEPLESDQGEVASKDLSKKQRRQQAASERQRTKSIRQEIASLEKQISELEVEKTRLQDGLAISEIYSEENKTKLKQMLLDQAQVEQTLEIQEAQWLELMEQLQKIEGG